MPEKTCTDYILKHSGTIFLHESDKEYGNPVSFERLLAYDSVGVFLYLAKFECAVFYPWASVKKMHFNNPMPMDLL